VHKVAKALSKEGIIAAVITKSSEEKYVVSIASKSARSLRYSDKFEPSNSR
jgi:hypothetical protein